MNDLHDTICAVLAGDAKAYQEIVRRFQAMAFGYAYVSLGDRQLAEDQVQEAFVEAYEGLASLREPAAFPGWFRVIVQRRCARARRARMKAGELEAARDVQSTDAFPIDGMIRRETASLVRAAIASLPHPQREITSLFYLGGGSHAGIAEFLELPIGTVKHQLHVARSTLRERMKTMRLPRVTSLAPQFLVDDLQRTIAYYRDRLGFVFGEPWGGFYAIGRKDGLELHFKCAPKNESERKHRRENEHLDASAGVEGIEQFYDECVRAGVTILKPLADTPWGTKDFYIEDPDGYIICFGGQPAS